jgi:hypothetical protein
MSEDMLRHAQDAPKLFAVPDPVSLTKDTAGPELAVPQEHDLDGKVYEGEIVAYRQPLPTRPIFAAWIVDRDERRMAGRWAWRYGKHTVLFQVARVPTRPARWRIRRVASAGLPCRGGGGCSTVRPHRCVETPSRATTPRCTSSWRSCGTTR